MNQAPGQRVQTLQNPQPIPQTPRQMESPARKSGQLQQQRTNGPPPGGGMLQELQKGFYEEGLEEVAAGFGLIKPDPVSTRKGPSVSRPIVHYMGSPQNAPPGSFPMYPPLPESLYPSYPAPDYSSPPRQDGRMPLPRAPPVQRPRLSFREMVQKEQQEEENAPGRRPRRAGARGGDRNKGLRHFSMKVCEKVEEKVRTTYNEVADELVREIAEAGAMNSPADQAGMTYDEKNIRRRVYDALNVLMAMDIIIKDKKEIHWRGLPSATVGDMGMLKEEKRRVEEQMAKKQRYLGNLHQQFESYENLVIQNQRLHDQGEGPGNGIAFPFVLIKTKPQATVEVEISEDMQLVHFDFNDTPYKMLDHDAILELKGLVNARPEASMAAEQPLEGATPASRGPLESGDHPNGFAVPLLESGSSSPLASPQEQAQLPLQEAPPHSPPASYQPVRQQAPLQNGIRKGGRGIGRGPVRRLLPAGIVAPQNGKLQRG